MPIIATNRIKTDRAVEIVFNLHKETGKIGRDSVTMTMYAQGMQATVFMSPQEACDLQIALERTNREFDEDDIIPEETAKDRFIESVCRPEHL